MNESLNIITGILYTEFDENFKPIPNPALFIPNELSDSTKLLISDKLANLIIDGEGEIPESIVVIPFPSKKLKGLIKCIKREDKSRAKGVSLSALTLIFNEIDDLVFYKYMKDLIQPFNQVVQKIIQLEEEGESNEKKIEQLSQFRTNILNILEAFREKELTTLVSEVIPEKIDVTIKWFEYRFKCIVIGDRGVGKTSLVLRFTNKAFVRKYLPTLGVNLSRKNIVLNHYIVQLIIWDIAGQTKFDDMRKHFYIGADGIFLVYDITRPETFNNLLNWHKGLMGSIPSEKKIFGYVIGNKNDLLDQRRIDISEGLELAKKLNLQFIETSALTGENVEESFHTLAKTLIKLKNE